MKLAIFLMLALTALFISFAVYATLNFAHTPFGTVFFIAAIVSFVLTFSSLNKKAKA